MIIIGQLQVKNKGMASQQCFLWVFIGCEWNSCFIQPETGTIPEGLPEESSSYRGLDETDIPLSQPVNKCFIILMFLLPLFDDMEKKDMIWVGSYRKEGVPLFHDFWITR
jgi:hypothetical protein